MVEHLQIEKTKPTFEGQIPTQEFIEAWKKDIESNARENATKSILYEVLPLVKENLEYQKEQYGAEKENTIVIARKEYVRADGGGYKEAELQSDKESRPIEAFSRNATLDRRGEGADAQEVTRYSISAPTFYLNAEFAVRNIKQDKATPEQWLKMIPHVTTLESIRKRKALLGKSKEEHDAFMDKWGDVYEELATKLHTT